MVEYKYIVRIYGTPVAYTTDEHSEIDYTTIEQGSGTESIDVYTKGYFRELIYEGKKEGGSIKVGRYIDRDKFVLKTTFGLGATDINEFETLRYILRKRFLYIRGLSEPYRIAVGNNVAIAVTVTGIKITHRAGSKDVELELVRRKHNA